jgi:hypothetical protein
MMRFGSADYHCLACAGGSIATEIMLYSFKMATVFCPNSLSVSAALKWFGHVGFCEPAVSFLESRAEIAVGFSRAKTRRGSSESARRRYAQLNVENWLERL